jgi:excisionase family DNA binding protein
MNEPAKNPFDPFFEKIREIVREEIQRNGSGAALLTAEELAKKLKVNKATVYQCVKEKRIPYYEAGRFVRFNLQEVLESQKKSPS